MNGYPLSGVEPLLDGIETAVKTSTNRVIGFILDADIVLQDRWRAVSDRLGKVGVAGIPNTPPPEGFIGESLQFKSRVGVWLMPDNSLDGKLEDFLMTLISDGDPIIGHANSSTTAARAKGAEFSEPDVIKAVIHAWLAWQKVPGLPYGAAVKAKYFGHESQTALNFVRWFKTLYRIA